jgi:hypothetical protein
VASKEEALRQFMEAYERTGEIRAQWLVLSSELLSDQTKAAAFYRGLRDDLRIHWLAGFTGRQGRGLWIGKIGVPTAR